MPCRELDRLAAELLVAVQDYGEALSEAGRACGTANFKDAHSRVTECRRVCLACQAALSLHEGSHNCCVTAERRG